MHGTHLCVAAIRAIGGDESTFASFQAEMLNTARIVVEREDLFAMTQLDVSNMLYCLHCYDMRDKATALELIRVKTHLDLCRRRKED